MKWGLKREELPGSTRMTAQKHHQQDQPLAAPQKCRHRAAEQLQTRAAA